MNKTEHYQLSLWDVEDAPSRVVHNEDAQKIDDALGNIGYIKLLDKTVESAVVQYDLDVGGIDFSQYWGIELYLDCPLASGNVFVRTNNAAEGYSYTLQGSRGSGSYDHMLYFSAPGSRAMAFSFLTPNPAALVVMTVHQIYWDGTSIETRGHSGISPVTWSELTTLNFYVTSGTIPAGTRFVLRGVKK